MKPRKERPCSGQSGHGGKSSKGKPSARGGTAERREEIESELQDLKELEYQECGTREPKHPSYTRPSAREVGFDSDAPSVDEILEAAIIQQGLRLKKAHLIFAKLSKLDPARWWGEDDKDDEYYKDKIARCEARLNRKIERTRERIDFGDIREATEGKLAKVDRVIAENYFQSQKLRKPLRELSADWASVELIKLGVDISPDAFSRALRRLCLVN